MKKEKVSYLRVDQYRVKLTRKDVKHAYLRINQNNGEICVSAPFYAMDAQVKLFVRDRSDWIERHMEKYWKDKKELWHEVPAAEEKIMREKLRQESMELIKYYEPLMGVEVTGVTIRKMKTRWGSCNVKTGHINLNLELAWRTKEQLTYVIIHEMCHLLEPNHSPAFWEHVSRYMPQCKQVRKSLRS